MKTGLRQTTYIYDTDII